MSENISIILVIFCADVIAWGNYSPLDHGELFFSTVVLGICLHLKYYQEICEWKIYLQINLIKTYFMLI